MMPVLFQRLFALFIISGVIVASFAQTIADVITPASVQASDYGICASAIQFVQQSATPYDQDEAESIHGGELPVGVSDVSFPDQRYMDIWAVVISRDDTNNPTPIQISFPTVDENLSLEFALYDGMQAIIPYQPVSTDANAQVMVNRDGLFSLIIRRTDISHFQTGNYQIHAQFEGGHILIPPTLRDQTINAPQSGAPFIIGGRQIVQVNTTAFQTHVRGVTSVGSHQGNASQVFFDSANSFLVNRWAETVYLLGGDLVVRGQSNDRPRLLFVQNYNHAISQLDGEVANITDGNGTQWRIDWSIIDAVWIGNDCAVFKLSDGRILASDFPRNAPRILQLNGHYQDFRVRVNNSELTLSWEGIINPVTTWYEGLFQTTYENDRQLRVNETRLDVRYQSLNALSTIQLHTRNTRIITDWRDIQALQFLPDALTIRFDDGIRTTTSRSADGLRLFEALDGVTRIDYDPTPDNPIDEIMLLPASDSLLEIITPAHSPFFDGRALPHERGYQARALNNTGAECYAVNSLIESAQCPPNGYINPANGNLFYAVTDLVAYGKLDLHLTRSYNSLTYLIDGIFGKGWATPYRLDYQIAYDEVRNSRPVTPDEIASFPVGLDVTYAPQGIVTFYTPSGSQHTFTGTAPFLNGTMTAITQPHWTLNRPDYRAGWMLTQSDGMTYHFDRAGRLTQYGYDDQHPITIDYSGEYLNGTADLSQTVIIQDRSNQRQLELTFDGQHVTEARLIGDDEQVHTTRYIYQNSLLTEVYYHDGGVAYYSYDSDGRLTHFNDPRAPFSREMMAEYGDNGAVTWYLPDQSIWQSLSLPIIDEEDQTITRTLIDFTTYPQSFTYAYDKGLLRSGENTFTLLAQTTRITDPSEYESLPITYTWANGLLTTSPHRFLSENIGRNTLTYEYNTAGYLTRIRGAHPNLTITYDPINPRLPRQIDYADLTSEQFSYDATGKLIQYQDRHGAEYRLRHDEYGQVIEIEDVLSATRTLYTYNQQGLMASAIHNALTNQDPPDAIQYTYDSFGNLTRIHDPLLGISTIQYDYHPDGMMVILTDALGAVTITELDHQSRLIRQTIRHDEQTLRDSRYEYDAIGRLISETYMLDDEQGVQTTYAYQPLAELPPFGADTQSDMINGTLVTVTDPTGRTTEIVYDGRERLRLYSQPSGYVERYDYHPTDDPSGLPNGLVIQERRAFNQRVFEERTYRFDLAWQLRSVITDTVRWDLSTDGTFLPRVLTPTPRHLFNSIQWAGYDAGQADEMRINQAINNPNTPTARLNQSINHHGQPTVMTINDVTYSVAYCHQPDGSLKTIYGYDAPDCETDGIYQTLHDNVGRLTQVSTPTGTRNYTYQVRDGEWLITVDFASAGTWELTVNAVGDVTRWTDHDNVRRDYQYDRLSRLVRVETSAPDRIEEASFTYTYNLIDLVTSAIDDVGHGLRYDYDALGRLIVAQDTRNANAIIYGYNADGLLASIISPLGNTTTILYQDDDPRRITGIVTPTGANLRFVWSDADNQLTFIDPRDQSTVYRFDGYGSLWQIEDALNRRHHIDYDDSGRLGSWRVAQQEANNAYQLAFTYHAPDRWQISSPHDDFFRLFSVTDGGALRQIQMGTNSLTLDYDALGRLINLSDSQGRDWALDWAIGSVTFVHPDGETQHLTYDALHRLLSDEGLTIDYAVPRLGEIQTTLTGINASPIIITSTQGDAITRPPSTRVQTTGTVTTTTRTPEGLLDEISFEGCIDSVTLAENGLDTCLRGDQVWRVSERVTYDPAGRPIRIVDANQNVETFAYDETGNLIVYQDSDGQSFNYSYDALNRLTSITSPTGMRVLFDYNDRDQVTAICRARAENAQTYLECASQPNRIRARYTYDMLGRLTAQETGFIPTEYTYDQPSHGQIDSIISANTNAVTFEYDALGLPQAIQLDDRTIDLTILPSAYRLNLLKLGDQAISYDALNRPTLLTIDDLDVWIVYSETGYSIQLENGQSLTFTTDERQLLTAITADDDGIGVTFDTFLSPDGRIQLTDALRSDGQLVQTQHDRLGQIQNNAYFDSDLLIDNTLTAGGLLQRQSIIGAGRYFLPDTQDYIIVLGYDNDSRPITMRISDRQSGQRIYLLTFTYDTRGRRQTETRQFRDNMQVTITYTYNTADQLIQRTIQSGRQNYTIDYAYDERGNLNTISDYVQTCRTYHYDSLNRLTMIEFEGEAPTYPIIYDALNRPSQFGDKRLIYFGDSNRLIGVIQDGQMTWHVDEMMQASGDQVTWLMHDGRGNIVNTTDAKNETDLWLFDPFKRLISLTSPIHAFMCSGMNLPDALNVLNPLINQADGTIWDMEAGLHFDMNGRVYVPELGVYLQQQPDNDQHLFNTAYDQDYLSDNLPIMRHDTAYLTGLQTLDSLLSAHTPLTAPMVLDQHLPNLQQAVFDGGIVQAIQQASDQQQAVMMQLLNLPTQIYQNYNLPTASRDQNGMLRLPTMNAPAHHTQLSQAPSILPERDADIMPTLQPTYQSVDQRSPFRQSQHIIHPLTFYNSILWTPTRPNGQIIGEQPQTPYPVMRPSIIEAWLPAPLVSPQDTGDLLGTLVNLSDLPQTSLVDWFMEALAVYLPVPVTLPPENLQAWREMTFSGNTARAFP